MKLLYILGRELYSYVRLPLDTQKMLMMVITYASAYECRNDVHDN